MENLIGNIPCSRGCFARRWDFRDGRHHITSFNPCSRGCFARSLWMKCDWLKILGFNPCSRGCFARRGICSHSLVVRLVSILVLVDVSLEVDLLRPTIVDVSVSILVLVDVSLEVFRCALWIRCIWFQSLFSWMFRSKIYCPPEPTHVPGFNPCSRGCFARRVPYSSSSRSSSCFNPCSRGCFARSVIRSPINPVVYQFQSLFSWMFRSKQQLRRSDCPDRSVSILVLVDVSLEVTCLTGGCSR